MPQWTIIIRHDYRTNTSVYALRKDGKLLDFYDDPRTVLTIMKIQTDDWTRSSAIVWKVDVEGPGHDERLQISTKNFETIKRLLEHEHSRGN